MRLFSDLQMCAMARATPLTSTFHTQEHVFSPLNTHTQTIPGQERRLRALAPLPDPTLSFL